jgi:hypothetical protein
LALKLERLLPGQMTRCLRVKLYKVFLAGHLRIVKRKLKEITSVLP